MIAAPTPPDERERLAALHQLKVLDTDPDSDLDDLTRLVAFICRTPMALVSLVDEGRQWFKSRVGVDVIQTPRAVSFCQHAILHDGLFVVPDATRDPRFADSPLVTDSPRIRFYAGIPLLDDDGHALGTLCTMDRVPRELTAEQRDALTVLGRQASAHFRLRKSYLQLQELERLRDSLTHMIVHDLRQPLQSIIGGLGSVPGMGDLTPEQSEFLEMALSGGGTLLGMINDLLDVSRMESGQLELQHRTVAPGELVASALEQVRYLDPEKGLELCSTVNGSLPELSADEDKLRRTLVNLLGNAVKFTPAGGRVTVSAAYSAEERAVRFAVMDSGEGIPEEAFGKIFEKFGQVENRKAGRKMSTGLGLTFCKMAVEAHGGRIWVESRLGQGSTFFFTIPAEARR